MPTPASVKLLYEETQNDHTNDIATWSPPSARGSSSRGGCCVVVILCLLMFLLGFFVGVTFHAIVFPGGVSPLDLLTSSNSTYDDSPLIDDLARVDSRESEEKTEGDDEDTDERGDRAEEYCKGFPWHDERLPSVLRPTSYNLTIHPNVTTNILLGSVAIDIEVMKKTKLVVLHAERLHLTSFWISSNGQKREAEHSECADQSQWAFALDDEIEEGDDVSMGIEFEGEVLPDLQGLYISTHTDGKGKKTKSAVTQFEPSFARKMFPCWDEPNYKATFELSVLREPRHAVRSNMNLRISKEHVDGIYVDVFHRSVKMSTYLLAVAVLDGYDYAKRTTRKTRQPIEVRMYAPGDVLSGQSEFGLDTAVRGLEYFEDYFNISYPLEKIDLLALDDFSEGAMENWGLVTFRDSALLHAEGTTSSLTKEHIALVICHEIAHQWFGNLVTMDWWNDLWLNEGFANYMEYKCVDHLFPTWNIMTRFYAENVAFSQEPDGLRSSRAISSAHGGSNSILSLFDAISYHKAAAIIHMIQSLSGERNFQKALVEYLEKYAYGNAKGTQLWEIVEKHASLPDGVSIASLAKAFTTQMGYPLIRISIDKDNQIVVLNQTRFFFSDDHSDDSSEWPLPIHYRTDKQTEPRLQWLKKDQDTVSWTTSLAPKWVIANTGGVGYFKVLYDEDIYKQLANQLMEDHTVISSIDRAMLLVDAFDFSKTSYMDIGMYMDLLQYAKNEDDRMAWTLLIKQMRTIDHLTEETNYNHVFKDFQRALILGPYEKYAWKNGTHKGLQLELVQLACRLRHRDCTKHAIAKYNEWMTTKKRPSPELVGVVLEEGVRQGGPAAWERTMTSYQQTTSPAERQHLIAALAATRDPNLISKLLRLCIEGSVVRPNVVPRVLAALSHNEAARTQTWRFFKLNFDEFTKILGEGSSLFTSALRAMAERLSTERDITELKAFLKEQKVDSNQKLDQMLEQMSLNVQWRRVNEAQLGEWLAGWDDRRRTLYRARKHARKM